VCELRFGAQPQSGERIQPTPKGVGEQWYKRKPRMGRKSGYDTVP